MNSNRIKLTSGWSLEGELKGSLIPLWQVVWHMRYWWQWEMAVAINRAPTTHLYMLTHKRTLTGVNTCTRNRGLIERVWTQPAVHMGMCLTGVTDSPNSAEEKTHINTRRLRRDWNTHPDMSWALSARLLKRQMHLCSMLQVHKHTVFALLLKNVSDISVLNQAGKKLSFLWLKLFFGESGIVRTGQYGKIHVIRQYLLWGTIFCRSGKFYH